MLTQEEKNTLVPYARNFMDAGVGTKKVLCQLVGHPQSEYSYWAVRSPKKGIPNDLLSIVTCM